VHYNLRFGEATLRQLIHSYTYEAGVRNLEREIGAICRKIARRVAENRPVPRVVYPALLNKYLGPPRHLHGLAEQRDEVGVATGMFWTANGGDTLTVEVSIMDGKGVLTMTGQLGDVMRESAQAALSFARANATRLGIESRRFEVSDIHIHVPEGAVPKDGPSAGITLAVALISALTGQAVRRDVAMTGEITLRGRVLPVGGVKEKVLGAHRAGIRTIILPTQNARDIAEVPAQVKRRLSFVYVEQMDEVFSSAFCEAPVPQAYTTDTRPQTTDTKLETREPETAPCCLPSLVSCLLSPISCLYGAGLSQSAAAQPSAPSGSRTCFQTRSGPLKSSPMIVTSVPSESVFIGGVSLLGSLRRNRPSLPVPVTRKSAPSPPTLGS
jgi:ATP-dependent Lon protease